MQTLQLGKNSNPINVGKITVVKNVMPRSLVKIFGMLEERNATICTVKHFSAEISTYLQQAAGR
jgi:hypothetical protein